MRKLEEWIEYMEGEEEYAQMGKLSLLLKHSGSDQVVLENLRRLRKWLKWADPAQDIEDQISNSEFLKDFHAKTMSQVMAKAQVAECSEGAKSTKDETEPHSVSLNKR